MADLETVDVDDLSTSTALSKVVGVTAGGVTQGRAIADFSADLVSVDAAADAIATSVYARATELGTGTLASVVGVTGAGAANKRTLANLTTDLLAESVVPTAIGAAAKVTRTGTDTIERNVQAILSETVSILDFGGVGDGVTNCRSALLKAIQNNKPFVLPKGTYVFTGAAFTEADIGAGGYPTSIHIISDNAVIENTSPNGIIDASFTDALERLFIIEGSLDIRCTHASGSGIRILHASSFRTVQIDRLKIRNSNKYGSGTVTTGSYGLDIDGAFGNANFIYSLGFDTGIRILRATAFTVQYLRAAGCGTGIIFDDGGLDGGNNSCGHIDVIGWVNKALVYKDCFNQTTSFIFLEQNSAYSGSDVALELDNVADINILSGAILANVAYCAYSVRFKREVARLTLCNIGDFNTSTLAPMDTSSWTRPAVQSAVNQGKYRIFTFGNGQYLDALFRKEPYISTMGAAPLGGDLRSGNNLRNRLLKGVPLEDDKLILTPFSRVKPPLAIGLPAFTVLVEDTAAYSGGAFKIPANSGSGQSFTLTLPTEAPYGLWEISIRYRISNVSGGNFYRVARLDATTVGTDASVGGATNNSYTIFSETYTLTSAGVFSYTVVGGSYDLHIDYISARLIIPNSAIRPQPGLVGLRALSADPGSIGAGEIVRANRSGWDPLSKGSGGSYLVMRNDANSGWVAIDAQG